jgi:peptide chain release factor subunit 1
MVITAKDRHNLKRFVKQLEEFKGRHTELVSVYIPEGYDMNKIINHLIQEKGTASNIKSTSTRKNVQDSLERMVQHLKLFKSTPPNGLAAFAGNVAQREGASDVQVWSIEPPEPLKTRIYRCDKDFVLDLLTNMLESKDMWGLVVMDRREGNLAILKGKTIIPLVTSTSNVPGKSKAGGQSSQRFERLREGAAKEFYTRLGEHMKDEFLKRPEIKGIIVGGPGPTKYDWVNGNFITNEVKKKIIAIKDICYTGNFGLQELLDASQDVLAKEEVAGEKRIMQRFFDLLAKRPMMVNYGEQHVMENLKNGVVDVLLLSEELEDTKIDEYEAIAEKVGSNVEIISTETREGAQLRDLGKVGAILRYEIAA